MNVKLTDRIFLTTEHSASSYGIPVLVIDGEAYGPADYGLALRQALYDPNDKLNWLQAYYTDEQLLLGLCQDMETKELLDRFKFIDLSITKPPTWFANDQRIVR